MKKNAVVRFVGKLLNESIDFSLKSLQIQERVPQDSV